MHAMNRTDFTGGSGKVGTVQSKKYEESEYSYFLRWVSEFVSEFVGLNEFSDTKMTWFF